MLISFAFTWDIFLQNIYSKKPVKKEWLKRSQGIYYKKTWEKDAKQANKILDRIINYKDVIFIFTN